MEDKISKAKQMAMNMHINHFRITGENYFEHVSRVASILMDANVNDENIIAATYIHHALDIGNLPETKIVEVFGREIYEILKEYKKLSKGTISTIEGSEINEKYIIQTYLNLSNNAKTLIIRLADKVDNIKTAYALPKDKGQKVAERALYLYAPICRLLGIGSFVRMFENEAFKILNPKDYFRIQNYLNQRLPEIHALLNETKTVVYELLQERKLDVQIKTRIKHIYSIYKKNVHYIESGKGTKLSHIQDIAAMRILVDKVEQCYMVEDLLKQLWDLVPGSRTDYIQNPKPSGYKSIHVTFKLNKKIYMEVQIRTHAMHEENEFGLASHTFYKTGEILKRNLTKNPDILKEMNYIEKSDQINIGHFTDKVYVFTPKGDIIELPRGANLIDFAYEIHVGLGNSCIGGIVNGDFQKLTYELQDGDRVEIKTSPSRKKPSADWVELAKTKKAKLHIKKALKEIAQF